MTSAGNDSAQPALPNSWIGVDYGKKTKGTTSIAYVQGNKLKIQQADAGQDADRWLLFYIEELTPERIFIDAPLSLPAAYFSPDHSSDFFYRQCDRSVQGMSPMFLGAMTARAIKLKHRLRAAGIEVIEAYPVGLAEELSQGKLSPLKHDPKKQRLWQHLSAQFPIQKYQAPVNQHQVDALLTWWIGYRYWHNLSKTIGDPEEGVIVV